MAAVYFVLSDRFRVDALLSKISAAAPRRPLADAGPDGAAVRPLRRARRADRARSSASAGDRHRRRTGSRQWEQANAASIARASNAMGDFEDTRADLAALSVLLRQIRTLVQTTSR